MKHIIEKILRVRAVLATLLLLGFVIAIAHHLQREKPSTASVPPTNDGIVCKSLHLSPLGKAPDWQSLAAYDSTMTKDEFEMSLCTIFTCSDEWKKYFQIHEDYVFIKTATMCDDVFFRLNFAKNPRISNATPKSWRTPNEMPPMANEARPLVDIHIAIDAGHIGGEWAQMEGRWFRIGDAMPVTEGDMTLRVAHLLKPALEQLGATVTLVRDKAEPLTSERPESLLHSLQSNLGTQEYPFPTRRDAEMLFYRTAEIRARADKVNQEILPDVVLCLHFNADAWGEPTNPQLVSNNHFHILLNGAYTDDELAYDDQRMEMTKKILQRTIDEEAALGAVMARVFVDQTAMPPYPYAHDSNRARNINGNPYLWARNLIANRLYDCPVIFFEPYVMNSVEFHQRVQMGDYEGMQEVNGTLKLSVYQEYTKAVVDGLIAYYEEKRRR